MCRWCSQADEAEAAEDNRESQGWGPSEAPEHGHSLADAHVMVVEVAEASEGQGRQNVQPRVGHFNGDVSVHVISYDLAQTPKRERKNQQRSLTGTRPLGGPRSTNSLFFPPAAISLS